MSVIGPVQSHYHAIATKYLFREFLVGSKKHNKCFSNTFLTCFQSDYLRFGIFSSHRQNGANNYLPPDD